MVNEAFPQRYPDAYDANEHMIPGFIVGDRVLISEEFFTIKANDYGWEIENRPVPTYGIITKYQQ